MKRNIDYATRADLPALADLRLILDTPALAFYERLGFGKSAMVVRRIDLTPTTTYDAMAESRPYHPGRPHEEIMDIMQTEVGHKYDPYLFDRFAAMIGGSHRKAPAA